MSNLRELGKRGEDEAVAFLQACGYHILHRNFRIKGGEIDIIARQDSEIVFIEVKTRSQFRYGYPEEGVHFLKERLLARTIREYLRTHRIPDSFYMRFDILSLLWDERMHHFDINHIKNVELPPFTNR